MSNLSRRFLPPIASLQSFAVAAHLGSFSRAAATLGLTQSAVSRQIAMLEDLIQKQLFRRNGRRVTLTAEGAAYADAVNVALDDIRKATIAVMRQQHDATYTIATLPSFGMRWLAPRLPAITAQHPQLVINIVARSYPFPLEQEGFDAAIHFGQPDWPDAAHDLLFQEQSIPVCSPELMGMNAIDDPKALLRYPLLCQSARPDAWKTWFSKAGVDNSRVPIALSIEHFLMLAQAAEAGAGIALIPTFMIEPELASGRLVCPFHLPLASDDAYYLVYPETRLDDPLFRHLRENILQQAGQDG